MLRKAQASLEYIIIFGIGFFFVLILGGLLLFYMNSAKNTLDENQIDEIGNQIVDTIEKVYYLGPGNKFTIKANFPTGIENLSITNVSINRSNFNGTYYYFNFTYSYEDEWRNTIISPSDESIPFTCVNNCTVVGNSTFFEPYHFNKGVKRIKVEALSNGFVNIEFVQQ